MLQFLVFEYVHCFSTCSKHNSKSLGQINHPREQMALNVQAQYRVCAPSTLGTRRPHCGNRAQGACGPARQWTARNANTVAWASSDDADKPWTVDRAIGAAVPAIAYATLLFYVGVTFQLPCMNWIGAVRTRECDAVVHKTCKTKYSNRYPPVVCAVLVAAQMCSAHTYRMSLWGADVHVSSSCRQRAA